MNNNTQDDNQTPETTDRDDLLINPVSDFIDKILQDLEKEMENEHKKRE